MPDAQRAEIAKLEALHADHPEGRIFTHLAEAYRKAGELDRARAVLAEGIGRHPDYSSAHVVLARVLVDQGERAEAEAEFHRVLELDAQNLVAMRALGDLARAAGRSDEAVSFYRRLLDIEPSDDDARELIAEMEAGRSPGIGESAVASEAAEGMPSEQIVEPEDGPWVGGSGEGETGDVAREPWVVGGSEEVAEPFSELAWSSEEESGGDDFPGGDFAGSDALADEPAAAGTEEGGVGEIEGAEGGGDVTAPEDDSFGPLPNYGEPGMMTETIAQVYARQGLYDRAAEVYRQLVRARPDDGGLRTRMEEMQALAAQAGGSAGVESLPALDAEGSWTGESDSDADSDIDLIFNANPTEAHIEPLPGLETTEGPPPQDIQPLAGLETDEVNPETGLRTEGVEGAEAVETVEEAEAVESVWTGAAGASEAEQSPYAWAPEEGDEAPEADASEPIGAYFRSLLRWSGGALPPARTPRVEEGGAGGGRPDSEPGPEDDDELDTFRSWLESLKQ